MDERELQQLFEKLQSGVQLTDEEMRKLARDTSAVDRAMQTMAKSFAFLGKQALDVGKKLHSGEQGASVYNDAITNSADALGNFLSVLGPLGKVMGFLVKAFGSYVAETNKLSDRLYKSYQGLSKVGVTAADGMIGLAESAQRLGYGLDDAGIENFGKLMKASAQDLALLSGSAVKGRQDFTEFAGEITRGPTGRALMNMGMSVEDINEGLASYMGLQARAGTAQNKTQAQLQAGAAAYLKEMDALTKLTGLQKAELEEGINKARAIEAFRAKVEDLRAQGREKEADEMEKYFAVLQKQAPTLAQGFAEAASGLIVSDAGRQYFQAIDSGAGIIDKLSTGAINATGALQATYQQSKLSEEQFRSLAMAMGSSNVVGSYTELADLAKRAGVDMETAAQFVKEQQDAQAKGPGGVAAQTDMRRAQMDSRDSLQNLVKAGVVPATNAMSGLASVTSKVVTALGGKVAGGFGGGGGAGAGAGGGGATADGGAPPTTRVGGVVGAIRDFFTGGGGGPDVAGWEDYIKFTGGTGSLEHFKKLEPRVQEAFANMAREYWNMTGQKLQVNSAFRSPEEQAAVQSGSNPKAAPGMSLHNQGRALDIQSAQAEYLLGQGMLDKYGFKSGTTFNDPPHIYMRDGGIAAGPKSGYAATLHGTEAVVPLPDGKTIPVTMPGYSDSMGEQLGVMGAQLAALESIVAAMRDQNTISNKILQATNA